ncbi:MAG: beta strand repeat-containing protein, partial [Bacteroidota bacterium]
MFFLFHGSVINLYGQVGGANATYSYISTQTTSTYSSIAAGTVHYSAAATSTDGVTAAVNIGFNFTFNGIVYTQVFISNNGFITFGTAPGTANYTPLSNTTAPYNHDGAISGFGANLAASTVAGAAPEVRSQLTGIAPNRVFVVQYKDIKGSGAAAAQRLTFQIQLKETSNVIDIVYGAGNASGTANLLGQVGVRGSSQSDYSNRTGTNWTTGAIGTANTNQMTLGTTNGTTVPAVNLCYRFTPPAAMAAPTYATLPFTENFDVATWPNGTWLQSLPSTASVRSWPGRGDNSWRRNNVTTANSGWTTTTGVYTIAAPASGGTARFHSYNTRLGIKGSLDFYFNFSPVGTKELKFDYINTSGTDNLQIQISTDAGATFTNFGTAYGTAAAWVTQTISNLSTSTSSTVVIRFLATSDFGATDIGVDNVRCCVLPTISANPSATAQNVCLNGTTTALSVTAANASSYQWYSNTTASTVGGTLISGATGTSYSPPSTVVGTTYYYCIVTNGCGSTVTSTVSGAVNIQNPSVAPTFITPSPSVICGSGSTTLTVGDGSLGGGASWQWYSGSCGGTSVGTGSSVVVSPASATTYFVRAVGCNTTACASTTISVQSLLDWGNLQFPSTASICGGTTNVYGQVYEPGVTPNAGADPLIVAQIGVSPVGSNTNPNTWTNWTNASWNVQSGNNDEYIGSVGAGLSSGTYYYAFRYSINGCAYQYGGLSGLWVSTADNGTLTVQPSHSISRTSAAGTDAQSVCPGTSISNITYSVGNGGTGASASGLPTGVSGNFSGGVFTISGTPSAASGVYNYTVTTSGSGCTSSAVGSITIFQTPDFGNLQFPATSSICSGGNTTIYGQVFEAGLTNPAGPGAGITVEYGYNSSNTNPNTWTNWFSATFSAQSGNNDEYLGTFGSSLAAGTYYYTFRYRMNGCSWLYGGYSAGGGGTWDGTTNVSGVLTVNATPTISTQPSNSSVVQGGVATYSVVATGSPTYQWQYSTTLGGTYNNVINSTPTGVTYSGATSATLTVTTSGTTPLGSANYYRCIVTQNSCSATSTGANMNVITYCTPSYATGTGSGDYIGLVNILTTTLNNTTTGAASPYYTLYSQSGSTTGTLQIGNTYTISVKGGTFGTCYISAWIDLNNDGDFADAGEFIGVSPNCGASTTVNLTTTWLVPLTATTGNIRMRFRSSDTSPGPTAGQSCGATNSGYGETEDYIVTLCSPPPAPGSISGTASVCSGTSQTYTVAAVSGATSYLWTLPTGWTGTSTTNSITVTVGSAGQNGNITVRGVNTCGNGPTSTLAVTSVGPVAGTAAASPTSICTGSGSVITLTGSTGTIQWEESANGSTGWANVTGGTGGTTATYSTPSLTSTTYYRAKLTSGSCAVVYSNTVTVTVGSPTTPGVSISASPSTTICTGTNLTFTASGSNLNGGTITNYEWFKNGVSVQSNASSTYAFSGYSTGNTVYCIITVSGCVSPSTATSATSTITVNAVPTVSVNSPSYCSGTAAIAVTASGANTYSWSPGTGLSATTGASVNANPSVTTIYTVTGTSVSGCTATATSTVTVVPAVPTPTVTINPSSVCAGSTATLTATPSSSQEISNYSFTTSSTTFNAITGGTTSTATGDDGTQSAISLGFNFSYGGATYSTISISTNGAVFLGSIPTSHWTNALATNPLSIAPLWDDHNQTGGSIKYQITGSAGAQVFTVEWNNIHLGGGGSATNPTGTFQLKLYEASGVIEFIYGTMSFTSVTASIGISGAVGNYLSITPGAPATASSVSENSGIAATTNLGAGILYRFTPPQVFTYAWSPTTFLSSTATQTTTAINATNSTTYSVTLSNGVCSNTGSSVLTYIIPSVGGTASSNQTICSGTQPANITLSGNTGSIQWQSSTDNITFNNIVGATATPLTSAQMGVLTATRYYRASVSNSGCTAANSNTVTVTVTPVSVGGTASSNQTICTGSNPSALTLSGNTGTIQWQVSTDNVTFTNISGATTSTLSSAQMGALTSVRYYRAAVTNGVCSVAYSTTVTITVNSLSVAGTASANQTICSGASPANITLAGNTGTVQWQSSTDNITFTNIAGATATSLTSAQMGALSVTTYYRAVVTNSPCSSINSNVVTVTVNPLINPSVSITSNYTSICVGTTVSFTATPTNGGASPSYQWKLNGGNVGTNSSNYSNSTLANGDQISCVLTSNASCLAASTANSNTITITVVSSVVPAVSISTGTTSICTGASVTFTATPTAGGSAPTYQWKLNGTNVGTSSTTYTNSSLANGDVVSCVMTSNDPCASVSTATSNSVTMTVNNMPTITSTTPGSSCGNGTVVLGATSSAGTINWYSVSTGGTSLGTGTSYTTAVLSSTTTYYVDATVGGCTTSSRTSVVATINPIPTISTTTPNSRCGTGTVTLGATASSGTINWYSNLIGGASLGSGISFTTPSISSTTTYYVDATLNGCSSSPRTAVVATVNTIPTISSSTPASICGPGSATISAVPSAGTVSWYTVSTGGSAVATGNTYSIASVTATTTYYADASANGCTSPSRTAVTVTVNSIPSAPTVTLSGPTLINVGGVTTYSATGGSGTINWYSQAVGGSSLGTGTSFTTAVQCAAGVQTYYAGETGAGGCQSTRNSANFTVRDLISSNPTNGIICTAGGSVILSANVTNGTSYSWTPTASLSSSNTAIVTASPTTTTQYTLNASVTGCASITGTNTFNVGVIEALSYTPTAAPSGICEGQTSVLNSNLSSAGFTYSNTTFSMATPTSPTNLCTNGVANVALASGNLDDGGWSSIPIGFNYNFFGNTYSSVNVGTNGVLLFGTYNATSLGDYTFASALPTATEPTNIIAAAANDYYASATGVIRYWTQGISPTRVFVVEWNAVPGYTTNGSMTVQVKLFETTGNVEVHVQNASSTYNKVVGLQNANATIGATAYSSTVAISNTAWKFVPGASYTFQWSTGGSPISGATLASYTTPALSVPGAVTYSVAATNPNTQCASTATVQVTVNSNPAAPTSGGNVTACSIAGTQTLTATPPSSSTVNWYSTGVGGTLLLSNNNNYTTSTSGTYYAGSVSTQGCNSPTRTGVTLTVNASPPVPTANATVSYCQGAIASALSATPAFGNTLNWYTVAVGGTPSTTAPTPSTASVGTTSYWVSQVSGTNGCEGPRFQITVTINAVPANPAVTSPVTYCQNAIATQLTATIGVGNTANWYTVPTGGTASGTAPTPSTSSSGTINYYVSQTNSNSCESSRSNIQVVVNPTLVASVNNSASSTSACSGGAIVFTATPTNGGTAPTYQWYLNNVLQSGQTASTYTLNSPLSGDQIYVQMVSNATPCLSASTVNSNTVTLTSTPSTPSVTISSSTSLTVCPNTSVTFSVNSTANMGSSPTYQWRLNGSNISGATGSTYTTTSLSNGNQVSLVMTSSLNGACLTVSTATSNVITYSISPATNITTQPVSASACLGTSQSFSVAATGTGTLTYQWKKGGVNITGNATAQTATLTLSGIAAGDAANYSVDVTGTCGIVSSNTVSLSLNAATAITTQPAALTTCVGTSATFSVVATGNGTLTYQWRFNGTPISGATSSTYTIPSVTSGNGGNYSVIVTGGCGSLTSSNALLTVNPLSSISTQPSAITVCQGNTATFAVTATGTAPLSYQWYLGSNPLSGATSSSYTDNSAQPADAGQYSVVVTGGCGSVTSNSVALTVNPTTSITTQPISLQECVGQSATFTVVATGTSPLTYQWKFNGSNISGATGSTHTISSPTIGDDGTYQVVVTGGCGTLNSNAVTLTVFPTLTSGSVSNTQTICSGTSPSAFTSIVAAGGGTGTYTYQWQSSTDGTTWTNISGANSTTYAPGTLTTTTYFRRNVSSGTCDAVSTNTITVTVNPNTAITAQSTASQTVCINSNFSAISVSANGVGLGYQWYSNTSASTTGGT